MARPSPREILLKTIRRTNQERLHSKWAKRASSSERWTKSYFLRSRPSELLRGEPEDDVFCHFFNQAVFTSGLNIVDSVPLQRRGSPSFVHTHRDKLLFLFVFLAHGTDTLKNMCLPHLNTPSAVLHVLHNTVVRFKDPLVRNLVRFRHERADGMPIVSAVVDCTVVEINGPNLPYGEKDDYYSGKHKWHCLKKEVIVNVRSGMAAMVSQENPGCFPDVEILRRHAQQVNQILGETVMLADKGYRGILTWSTVVSFRERMRSKSGIGWPSSASSTVSRAYSSSFQRDGNWQEPASLCSLTRPVLWQTWPSWFPHSTKTIGSSITIWLNDGSEKWMREFCSASSEERGETQDEGSNVKRWFWACFMTIDKWFHFIGFKIIKQTIKNLNTYCLANFWKVLVLFENKGF